MLIDEELRQKILRGEVKPINNYCFVYRLPKPDKPTSSSLLFLSEASYCSSKFVRVLAVPDLVQDPYTKTWHKPEIKRDDLVLCKVYDCEKIFEKVDKSLQLAKYDTIEAHFDGSLEELLEKANNI